MHGDNIHQANQKYEEWLRDQLRQVGHAIVTKDLKEKHEIMKEGAFPFLRATYWRWAQIIPQQCPELTTAPRVLAVGDIHLENYGTWRDAEGRLIWGINDFDEAAEMPYALDLIRLAVSAMLSDEMGGFSPKQICLTILGGYREGLKHPCAFVLDESHTWLFERLGVSAARRKRFWKEKVDKKKPSNAIPKRHFRPVLLAALPKGATSIIFKPRKAGVGSLGRPRWLGIAEWNGGRVVREAKSLVPSAWTRVFPAKSSRLLVGTIAAGRYRAPDPHYQVHGNIVVRRLSPNNRKIEIEDEKHPEKVFDLQLLYAMGHELANVHLGLQDRSAVIAADMKKRSADWLLKCATAATISVGHDFKKW